MRRLFYTLFLLSFVLLGYAQKNGVVCDLGFTYKISNDPNWGQNEPIVTEVVPGSPADAVGIRVNDIILEVNGNGTYLKPIKRLKYWFAEDPSSMSISIRNFFTAFKTLEISKSCKTLSEISEAEIATLFSFYSLEDIQNRRFTMPITTTTNNEVIFSTYRTFDFVQSADGVSNLDEEINSMIATILESQGLKRDKSDPDFIIQTWYNYTKNTSSLGVDNDLSVAKHGVWRYSINNKRVIKMPIFQLSEKSETQEAPYVVEFGFSFYDRKQLSPGISIPVLETSVKEGLSINWGLMGYLKQNLPLLLAQFPHSSNKSNPVFHANLIRYNYTGISYNTFDLRTVESVAAGSPADIAGIRSGDVIVSVWDQPFKHTVASLTTGYRAFLRETMKYRDKSSRYTDAKGFKEAMFWDISNYFKISKSIRGKQYRSAFLYLFGFNQYINWDGFENAAIPFEVLRNGETLHFDIIPMLKESTSLNVE